MNITLEQVVKELKLHQQLDHYIQGQYYDKKCKGKFRGCSIGCAVESLLRLEGKTFITGNAPEELERIGVPQSISRMIEFVFEKLPHAEAVQYSIDCHEAMIGKTKLDDVMRQQHIWMLKRLNSPNCKRILYLLKNNGTQEEFIAAAWESWAVRMAGGSREASAVSAASAAWIAWAEVQVEFEVRAERAKIAAEAAWSVMDENFIKDYADNLLKLIKEAD
jgi:hypothetical protein